MIDSDRGSTENVIIFPITIDLGIILVAVSSDQVLNLLLELMLWTSQRVQGHSTTFVELVPISVTVTNTCMICDISYIIGADIEGVIFLRKFWSYSLKIRFRYSCG